MLEDLAAASRILVDQGVFDAAGQATERSGRADGVPVWSFGAAIARRDGGFTVLY